MRYYEINVEGRLILQRLSVDPLTTTEGRLFLNTVENNLKYQDGSSSIKIWSENNVDELLDILTSVNPLKISNLVYFDEVFNNGSSGTSKTINWNSGNRQYILLTNNCTISFTNPIGPCNLLLTLKQDAIGSRIITWPGSVKWAESTVPTLSTSANAVDIVGLYFDGINYYSTLSKNFG